MASNETFDFRGPAGRLEAILMLPEGPPSAAAVVCHAHPLHGGMMHFKVVFRAAKALQSAGLAVLRFNFRGVGRSEGVHDHGAGEQEDARAALVEMQGRFPGLPLVLGGFSFGSAVALRVAARDARVRAVFALGYPLLRDPRDPPGLRILAEVRQPRLFVQGENDEFGPGETLRALVLELPPPPRDRRDPRRRPLLRRAPRRAAGRDRRLGRASSLGRRRPSSAREHRACSSVPQAEGRGRRFDRLLVVGRARPAAVRQEAHEPPREEPRDRVRQQLHAAPEPPRHAEGVGREDRGGVPPEDRALLPRERGAEQRQRDVRAERAWARGRARRARRAPPPRAPARRRGRDGPARTGRGSRPRRGAPRARRRRSGRAGPASGAPSPRTPR